MRKTKENNRIKYTRHMAQMVSLCLIIICSFFAQLTKTYFFPQKYFYDATVVFNRIGEENFFNMGDSYEIASFIFSVIHKAFPFSSMQQWNIAIWVVMGIPTSILLGKVLFKCEKNNLLVWGMCFGYMILLPIFCWNTQKEAIQYFFSALLLASVSLCELRLKVEKRMFVIVSSLLFAWGIAFRNYYLLIACLFVLFVIMLCWPWENYSKTTIRKICICALLMLIGIYICLYLCKNDVIYRIFNSRMGVNQSRIGSNDANTIILDWVNNNEGKLFLHFINYFINMFRLLLPFELIRKGTKYIAYIGIQLFMSAMLGVGVKTFYHVIKDKAKQKKDVIPSKIKILLCVMVAWYLVAFIFEPDFGSFLRHQVAMFPVFCPIYCFILEGHNKKTSIIQEW